MARLSKFPNCGRQRELFPRAEIPSHVPRIEHYAAMDRRREVRGAAEPAPVAWDGLGAWLRQVAPLEADWRLSEPQRRRLAAIASTIGADKIRASRDAEGLELVEAHLADWRNNGLGDALSRAEIGALLVEVRNRLHQLAIGRTAPKPKGPRLDPDRIPLHRLEALIQSHPDMELVERLRAARNRRK